MNATTTDWANALKDKSILVRHEDVESFCDFFKSCGLVPLVGANLGDEGQVIYF